MFLHELLSLISRKKRGRKSREKEVRQKNLILDTSWGKKTRSKIEFIVLFGPIVTKQNCVKTVNEDQHDRYPFEIKEKYLVKKCQLHHLKIDIFLISWAHCDPGMCAILMGLCAKFDSY